MPEAFISITTSPEPGVGSGSERNSTLRLPRNTAPRMRLVLLHDFAAIQLHGGGRAFPFPCFGIDHFTQEVEFDGDVVRVLEEDLEKLGVREAAEVHLDLVLLDAAAHFVRILGEKGYV